MKRKLPPYVSEFADRHGKWRVRFRRIGQASSYFHGTTTSDEFWKWYAACLDGKAAPRIEPGANRSAPGTINDLIERYYRSPAWESQSDSTQRTYRGIIERFRTQHGDKPVKGATAAHIDAILSRMSDTPAAANNLRKVLNRLFSYSARLGLRRDNPVRDTLPFKNKGDGFHTWTEDEIEAYQACHPTGTRARLALELMLWTGQRRSDVITLGRQHLKGNVLTFRQQKTGKALSLEIMPDLDAELAQLPAGQMTFLVTEAGAPFTANGFGNWFRDMCRAAGLAHCSAHGLRKAVARRMAEDGMTHSQGKAVTGHTKDSQFSHYAARADQQRLAKEGLSNLYAAVSHRRKKLAENRD